MHFGVLSFGLSVRPLNDEVVLVRRLSGSISRQDVLYTQMLTDSSGE